MDDKDYKKQLLERVIKFGRDSIKFVDSLPNRRSCWIIGDQYLRSSTSVGANVVEAQASSSRRDFVNFLTHALKSANESKYWLILLADIKDVNQNERQKLLKEADELAKILGSSTATLKGQNKF
ncbi:MAG TPA: four helix bundle protein [Patescibacteria group bacterium]|nr:four helix bundle protein [Patescibacteria group bacterium]